MNHPLRHAVPTLCLLAFLAAAAPAAAEEPWDIGSRRQLFVDDHLVGELKGLRRVLHHPVRREIAIKPEHPWEKFGVSYMCVIRDPSWKRSKFRAWYRVDAANFGISDRRSMTAYAESDDGIHWRKPKLGLIEYDGSKENNLVWSGQAVNLGVFRDDNPACKPGQRYKAIARTGNLHTLVSPDGLRWKLFPEEPVFTDRPFDSHNIGFWDGPTRQYVVYTRGFRTDGPVGRGMLNRFKGGVRWVRRATSKDFLSWSKLVPIKTGDRPREEFYTNATIRYERAPDTLLMFPSRFASAREPKPGWKGGKGVNDIVLLASLDGLNWDRSFMKAFIRPGLDRGNWHDRSLYMERGLLETSPTELSLYCMQNWRIPTVQLRRYTLRLDGFVSVQADYDEGTLRTSPLRFTGKRLFLNYSTSAVGSLRVEVQDARGKPIPGFSLDECPESYGDWIDREVRWKSGGDLSKLAGQVIHLKFALADGDLYAFRFGHAAE